MTSEKTEKFSNPTKKEPSMPKIEINTYHQDEVEKAASSRLTRSLEDLLQAGTDVLLLLSGGANIEIAKQALLSLQEKYATVFSSHVTMMVLDERYSAVPQTNNSLQLLNEGIHVERTVPQENESVESFGERFNALLQGWLDAHPKGKLIATLGMGPDGHIAGISPMKDDPETFARTFLDTQQLAVGYAGNLEPRERVTVTPAFLQKIDTVLGYIPGAAKREALLAFRDSLTEPHEHPVQLLHQLSGKIVLTTDIDLQDE